MGFAMTQVYDDTNRGTLFKNNRKEKESHPDYNGKINVNGENYDLSAWLKESKSGMKFFSISVRPPYQKPASEENAGHQAQKANGFIEDDLPF